MSWSASQVYSCTLYLCFLVQNRCHNFLHKRNIIKVHSIKLLEDVLLRFVLQSVESASRQIYYCELIAVSSFITCRHKLLHGLTAIACSNPSLCTRNRISKSSKIQFKSQDLPLSLSAAHLNSCNANPAAKNGCDDWYGITHDIGTRRAWQSWWTTLSRVSVLWPRSSTMRAFATTNTCNHFSRSAQKTSTPPTPSTTVAHSWGWSTHPGEFDPDTNMIKFDVLYSRCCGLIYVSGSKTVSALWCKFSRWCWAHDIWLCRNGCWAAEAPVPVCTWTRCFGGLNHPGPNRIGCFCARLLQGLQRVITNNVLFIHGCLIRCPVVGYLNSPEMASNRLCNISVIIMYDRCLQGNGSQ